MTRRLTIIACILALVVGMFVWVSPPSFIRELGLPEIAKALPSNFKDAESEFNNRVRSRFAAETNESNLMSELTKMGFSVDALNNRADVSRNGFPCSLEWWIIWGVDANGVVMHIDGHYGWGKVLIA